MKIRTAFIILFVLLLTAAGLVWLMDPWSTTGSGLPALLPQEPEKITEVQVISEFDTLVFHRSDSLWMMEGEEMNPGAVENLVYAASRLSLRSIVPADEVKEPGAVLEILFRKGNREAGHFFFVASASGYMVAAPGADRYFGVELPGYSGLSLEKFFSGNPDHYRQHLLVDLLPSEIAAVEVVPWKGTAFVVRQDSAYNISVRLAETGADVTAEVDEHKIRLLFSYFNAIRYDRVAGPGEVDRGSLHGAEAAGNQQGEMARGSVPGAVAAGNEPGEVARGSVPGAADTENMQGEVAPAKVRAAADGGSLSEEMVAGSLPSAPWASVAVTAFDGVRRQFDVYQWVKPGAERPDLFEALVVFNGRPLLLVMNYYYLDLLVRGLEDYR